MSVDNEHVIYVEDQKHVLLREDLAFRQSLKDEFGIDTVLEFENLSEPNQRVCFKFEDKLLKRVVIPQTLCNFLDFARMRFLLQADVHPLPLLLLLHFVFLFVNVINAVCRFLRKSQYEQ